MCNCPHGEKVSLYVWLESSYSILWLSLSSCCTTHHKARCSEGQMLSKRQGAGSQVQWQDWQGKVSLASKCPTDETFYIFFFLYHFSAQPSGLKCSQLRQSNPQRSGKGTQGPDHCLLRSPTLFFQSYSSTNWFNLSVRSSLSHLTWRNLDISLLNFLTFLLSHSSNLDRSL